MMLTGAAISAALGAVVSYRLYKKAGDDLRKKAAKLRQLHELTLYALFNREADLKPKLDANGKIIGIIVGLASSGSGVAVQVLWQVRT